MHRRFNHFKIAIGLSSLSLFFGILREFLICGLLGFTAKNDQLQLYLSIFFTIGLAIDAMRLACLNLYSVLSLPRILFSASLIGLPFSMIIGFLMSYATAGLNILILSIAILGSYLNLIAALLITYKQRNNFFLSAQLINVMPNFVLIPGVIFCYWFVRNELVLAMVTLTSMVPVLQCFMLLMLPHESHEVTETNGLSLFKSVFTFARHFAAMIGEQLFQIITRSSFYNFGAGYLSVFAITIRIYFAARFILVDSFIGSKLANWRKELKQEDPLFSKISSSFLPAIVIAFFTLLISLNVSDTLFYAAIKIIIILFFGFYFSTAVRIIYFKINHLEHNSTLILRFAIYELIFAFIAFVVSKQLNYPILTLLWIGYIAKPFAQLLLLHKRVAGITTELREYP